MARSLSRDGHSLQAIVDPAPGSPEMFNLIAGVADPEKPIGAEQFVSDMFGGYVPARNISTVLKVIGAGLRHSRAGAGLAIRAARKTRCGQGGVGLARRQPVRAGHYYRRVCRSRFADVPGNGADRRYRRGLRPLVRFRLCADRGARERGRDLSRSAR